LNATSYRDHGDYRRGNEQTVRALAAQSTTPIRIRHGLDQPTGAGNGTTTEQLEDPV
jgi:hypothetical protein